MVYSLHSNLYPFLIRVYTDLDTFCCDKPAGRKSQTAIKFWSAKPGSKFYFYAEHEDLYGKTISHA